MKKYQTKIYLFKVNILIYKKKRTYFLAQILINRDTFECIKFRKIIEILK
jgi:hypothetical protein